MSGDLNACDASRILRIPGTDNVKYNPPRVCEVSKVENFYYNLDAFEILPEIPEKNAPDPTDGDKSDWLREAMTGCSQGARNATATKIAGYYINKLSLDDTLVILQNWNKQNTPPLPDQELAQIVKSVARYEPEKKKQRVDISNVYTADRMLEAYQEYMKNLENNIFRPGITPIDQAIRGVGGGEVLTILARAGAFKTAMLQNMLFNYTRKSEFAAVFFSIEMPVASVTERYLQILGQETGQEIESAYRAGGHNKKIMESVFKSQMERVFVVPVKISLSDIGGYVRLIESEHNVKVGVIGIDYMGLIDGPGNNEYEIISRLARGAKDTAKLLNLPVVILSQVSRKGGEGEVEVSMDMGRGSGAIEEGADFILGLWQVQKDVSGYMPPPSEPVDEYDLICRILKNRKGPKGSRWKLELDPTCFLVGSNATPYEPPKQQTRKGF